jgi:hypothetical protein
MKILSLRQPWAHLVVSGTKDIENRTWSTNYRGPFLVHASLNIDKEACRAHRLDPAKLEGGGVVGMAEIIDVVTEHRSKWFLGPFGSSSRTDAECLSCLGRAAWDFEMRRLSL